MKLDITNFVKSSEPHEFSASQAELGKNAGKITWNNAKREAAKTLLLSESALDAFRVWVADFGAWSEDEIAAWDAIECNALLIQFISGDLRKLESLCPSDYDEYGIDWEAAEKLSSEGTIEGSIFKGGDGNVYFYMCS